MLFSEKGGVKSFYFIGRFQKSFLNKAAGTLKTNYDFEAVIKFKYTSFFFKFQTPCHHNPEMGSQEIGERPVEGCETHKLAQY
jgi:hypothetical protein